MQAQDDDPNGVREACSAPSAACLSSWQRSEYTAILQSRLALYMVQVCKCRMARSPAKLILLCGRVAKWRMVQLQLQDKCGGSSLQFACGHLRLPGTGLVCTCILTKASNLLGVGPVDIIRSISDHPSFNALMADRQAESALQHCAAHENSVSLGTNSCTSCNASKCAV